MNDNILFSNKQARKRSTAGISMTAHHRMEEAIWKLRNSVFHKRRSTDQYKTSIKRESTLDPAAIRVRFEILQQHKI